MLNWPNFYKEGQDYGQNTVNKPLTNSNKACSAPALGLLDVTKPFYLFVDVRKGIAKRVLTQNLGPWKRPVAYLSTKLDPVAAGCPPPCLCITAAAVLIVKDADKLTLGQSLIIGNPHALEEVLKQPPDRW